MLDRRRRRTPQEIAADDELDCWAVVIIGWTRRLPRTWGDNHGWWGCKVVVTKDIRQYLQSQDLGAIDVTAHAWVWTKARVWAERLREAVVAEIARQAEHLRRSWYDLDPAVAELTLVTVARQKGIEVMTHEAYLTARTAAIERAVRAFREMREFEAAWPPPEGIKR